MHRIKFPSIMQSRYGVPVSRFVRFGAGLLLLLLFAVGEARAQRFATISNTWVTASVCKDRPAGGLGGGRFFISAGNTYGNKAFLYATTSNVVFRIVVDGTEYLFTNSGTSGFGGQPLVGGPGGTDAVQYAPYDNFYVSPGQDSVVVTWKNLMGYAVKERLYVEPQKSVYSTGSDVIIEFEWNVQPYSPPSDFGIFLMLDTYNGQASGTGGSADFTSILTSEGYFPDRGNGKLFIAGRDSIPEFYHVGNFLLQYPLNTLLPVHRLKGLTHNGDTLTPPDQFAIGDWANTLRFYSWDMSGGEVGRPFGDCATAMRWEHLRGSGKIRTAYGMDDRDGNNLFHCRDSAIFMDVKTERLIEQKEKNGKFTPDKFNVDVWVTNTNADGLTDLVLTLAQPIGGAAGKNRLTIDPSTPGNVRYLSLPRGGTKKITWVLDVAPGTNDSLLDIPLDFLCQYLRDTVPRSFRMPCSPIISIRGFQEPKPPQDTVAPLILHSPPGKTTWPIFVRDRHPGYKYDTGLDKILITANDNNNFLVTQAPAQFTRCDTNVNVNFLFTVVDTTKPARVVFCAYDCRGNVSCDSVFYRPRPDLFAPEILSMVSLGSFGPPCNARVYEVRLIDSTHQMPGAGDNGFGIIETIGTPVNFDPLEINFDRGDAPIGVFDFHAGFRAQVKDSMMSGSIAVRVADYAGNADTITFDYCTLPDILPPVSQITPVANPNVTQPVIRWDVHTGDIRAWDRGLQSVVALSLNNMIFKAPPLSGGESDANFSVTVQDTSVSARLTVEVRDTYYNAIPAGHADTLTFVYEPIPDTMAPLIAFLPDAATNGASALVRVDDIHAFPSGAIYAYDLGLKSITVVSRSQNIEIDPALPINFKPADASTTFGIRIIDTLAMDPLDSICIEAVDLYGNRSMSCYHYPIQPDTNSPLLTGALDPTHTTLSATITDARSYDRGLGSIVLENPVNIAGPISLPALGGAHSRTLDYTIPDPTKAISGTFTVVDLVGEIDNSLLGEMIHVLRIPFEIPAVDLRLTLPDQIEQGGDIRAALIAMGDFDQSLVRDIAFDMSYSGNVVYAGTANRIATLVATPAGNGTLRMLCTPAYATGRIQAGDTLGIITFTPMRSTQVESLLLTILRPSMAVNGNVGNVITVQKPNDAASSRLMLPPPFFRLAADSVTYINGICDRILTSLRDGRAKLNGLAILALSPQPAAPTGGTLYADVRDIPAEGAIAELISADGLVVATMQVKGGAARVSHVAINLPSNISSGAYLLRMTSAADHAWAKVLIAR
ncbi:MAG: hypothetical protein JWQ98_3618 [Chlorobi bacterium]|nr:hypothetical protein [Chlorobiota bacterium]